MTVTMNHHTARVSGDAHRARLTAELHAQLAEARKLLAETRLRCATMLTAACEEADDVVTGARRTAHRILSDAHEQAGIDVRENRPNAFSDLWDESEATDRVDDFFAGMAEREAAEVFSA